MRDLLKHTRRRPAPPGPIPQRTVVAGTRPLRGGWRGWAGWLSLGWGMASAAGALIPGRYDPVAIRDPGTLEVRVVEDWKPLVQDPSLRQKLIEITVCEWWPGQKVRLPVTFNAPATGGVCTNLIIDNAGLAVKAALPTAAQMRLLKEERVGVVLIGMGTIDAMEPVGKLDVGMKEHLLKTKDLRYTPAWIWGLSDQRALTAACAERDVFRPVKVLATGGSKRGVAAAAAGIADDRFTAILPVVAPIVDSPGGPYVEGTQRPEIVRANEEFLAELRSGRRTDAPASAYEALVFREKARADERITLAQAQAAGWSAAEIKLASAQAWEVCRTTHYLPALRRRGLEIFYNQGANDNVSPGLLELGRRHPSLPIYVVPGGQHGGAKEIGFLKQVGSLPEVQENLYAFAQHHFFNRRPWIATPRIKSRWDPAGQRLVVSVQFPEGSQPQQNALWWSVNRHPDYTFAMEYDAWQSVPLRQVARTRYEGEAGFAVKPRTLDIVTTHRHNTAGSTQTFSSPLVRLAVP